jgi:hypothetical protein
MENPDADVNSEAPAAREIKQSGRALISAALVPLDRLLSRGTSAWRSASQVKRLSSRVNAGLSH